MKINSECLIQWNQLKRENDPSEELDLITLQRSIENYYQQNCTEIDEQAVRITIRRIRNAVKHKGSENLSVRKSAQKVLKSLRHPFQNTIDCANRFDKEFRKSKELDGNSQNARVITLNNDFTDFTLEEIQIQSICKLIRIGKSLDNCVKERETAKKYLSNVKKGMSSLYLLSEHEMPCALINIDKDDNKIVEFEVRDDSETHMMPRTLPGNHENCLQQQSGFKWSYDLGIEILNRLGTNADEVEAFVEVGAFSQFKNERPDPESVSVGDGEEMLIWFFDDDELIIASDENANGELLWSRFIKVGGITYPEWDVSPYSHMSVGELFEVIRQNPHVLEKLQRTFR